MSAPFQHILLATEGTEFDTGAQRVGIDLAASCGVPLMAVMPLVSNPVFESLAPELAEKADTEAATKLANLRLAAQASGVELADTIRHGQQPFREIVDEADERQADLLVLRRRGTRSYLANLLLGEMVHTVTGHVHCNVLIVPRATQLWSHAVLVATDGSPYGERATAMAAALAAHRDLPLTIISVAEQRDGAANADAAETHVESALIIAGAAGAKARGRVVTDGKPADAILAVAREIGADLIVIGRRGLNRMERILVGSTSESVAGGATCPVLIVQQAAG